MLNWVLLAMVPPSTPTLPPQVSPTPMALPALPPLLTSPIATAPPLAEAVATPPLPAEAVSVNCMMICPPLCPPKATQPDPEPQCQPVRSCHPSCDPRASYHRLGGHVNGDVRKPYRFWMHQILIEQILLVKELRKRHPGQIGKRRKSTLELPDEFRASPKNAGVQLRIGVSQPGGEELVVVVDRERSIRQPHQIKVEVVPEQDWWIRGGVQPSRMGHVRVPPFEMARRREDRERVERLLRGKPLQELVSR